MYARRVGGKELTFDFADGLIKDNLLIVDRETGSVWSQLHGKAVIGPLKDTPLVALPAIQTTWKFWREQHPATRVMVMETEGRPYLYRTAKPGASRPPKGPSHHDTSRLGLGLSVGGESAFFAFHELRRVELPLHVELGGQAVTIHYRDEALTAWAEDAAGELLPGVLVYEDAWRSFHPESTLFKAEVSDSGLGSRTFHGPEVSSRMPQGSEEVTLACPDLNIPTS